MYYMKCIYMSFKTDNCSVVHSRKIWSIRLLQHHLSHVKRGLIRCLRHRIDSITSREVDQKSETDWLRRVLRKNGYPTQFVLKSSCRRPKNSEKQKPVATVVIPCTQGLSESIRRVCQEYNIRIVFGAGKSLRTILTKAKDRLPQEHCIQDPLFL